MKDKIKCEACVCVCVCELTVDRGPFPSSVSINKFNWFYKYSHPRSPYSVHCVMIGCDGHWFGKDVCLNCSVCVHTV